MSFTGLLSCEDLACQPISSIFKDMEELILDVLKQLKQDELEDNDAQKNKPFTRWPSVRGKNKEGLLPIPSQGKKQPRNRRSLDAL